MRRAAVPAFIAGLVLLAVCVFAGVSSSVAAETGASGSAIVTIQVVDETYKIELTDPAQIATAEQLLAGTIDQKVPIGTVVRDSPGPNAPWTWHIDPATFEWADMTTEVCDGLPSYVEDSTVTSPYYCPWSAKVIAVER